MNRERVIVPPTETIQEMETDDILALRIKLVDAAQTIEAQIKNAYAGPVTPEQDWLIRTQSALSHMRRGLAVIKATLASRGVQQQSTVGGNVHDAFVAVDAIRDTLKGHNALLQAVEAFLEDDNDDNYARLENTYLQCANNG